MHIMNTIMHYNDNLPEGNVHMPALPINHYVYVEDDEKSRAIMQIMMTHVVQNCTLTMFDNGVDFLNALADLTPPSLILLDIHMKPIDGFALLVELRTRPEYAHIPVVALTASVMSEEVQQLRTAGFSGAISKPINPRTFPQLVAQLALGEAVWSIAE
jgi:CheY-like chemotaxis protein